MLVILPLCWVMNVKTKSCGTDRMDDPQPRTISQRVRKRWRGLRSLVGRWWIKQEYPVPWDRPRIGSDYRGRPIRISLDIDEMPFLAISLALGALWSCDAKVCGVWRTRSYIHALTWERMDCGKRWKVLISPKRAVVAGGCCTGRGSA
jgi:hypothetical protein